MWMPPQAAGHRRMQRQGIVAGSRGAPSLAADGSTATFQWSARGARQIARLHPLQPAGAGSRVGLRVERRGRTVKGRLLAALLRLTGRPVFCGDLRKALAALAAA